MGDESFRPYNPQCINFTFFIRLGWLGLAVSSLRLTGGKTVKFVMYLFAAFISSESRPTFTQCIEQTCAHLGICHVQPVGIPVVTVPRGHHAAQDLTGRWRPFK
ncbi:MAG: hypothetical protein QF735_09420 [Phycisphaeraceae bacterium]|nr:hypothetical protein [Phycisphaeraceae bacterium]